MQSNSVNDYISEIKACLDQVSETEIRAVVELIFDAYKKNKYIFILGNGGSSSTASHFACDLNKTIAVEGKPRLKAVSLTDNVPVVTAIANDISYDAVFKEQLITFLNKGDVVICITASGNSPNVLEAADYAKAKGAITIGLIGFGGGKLRQLVDRAIVFSVADYGQVEGAHSVLAHLISKEVGKKLREKS